MNASGYQSLFSPLTSHPPSSIPYNPSVVAGVMDEASQIINGKSVQELLDWKADIANMLSQPGMDVEYWEAVAKKIDVQLAKLEINDMHADLLEKRLAILEKQQLDLIETELTDLNTKVQQDPSTATGTKRKRDDMDDQTQQQQDTAEKITRFGGDDSDNDDDDSDSDDDFSPLLLQDDEDVDIEAIVDADADMKRLQEQRVSIIEEQNKERQASLVGSVAAGATDTSSSSSYRDRTSEAEAYADFLDMEDLTTDEALQLMKHSKVEVGMSEDEFNDSLEVPVTNSIENYDEKYRPRKPQFFNKIRTGYDWNAYNRVHYSYDNPPPKTVLGYQFNM
eukprot:TRINITY_DN2825_c0_g1_i1.p1 TRINITY_DN2825_c0_g1~~TRINITY_DN2825_c0_g1_i1.p1  ORF type:complete len:336 (+),score=137.03 TRINITY_DN2825_c0_g1_i1:189-1196(+)